MGKIALMRDLIKQLNEATIAYDKGAPIMEDIEWDNAYFLLFNWEKELGITLPNSPTSIINFDEKVSELKSITHEHDMLSLPKTKILDEVNDFVNSKPVIIMPKLDGLTCSLTYEKGKLIRAETRGNGLVGESIIHNAMKIKSIPKVIDYKDRLVIDGEIISTYANFENFKADYKNPRNFAAGSIRLLDSAECYNRGLTFVAWEVIEGLDYSRLSDKLKKLKGYDFTVTPHTIGEVIINEHIDWVKEISEELSYPIDGAVIKFDVIDYGKSLGKTAHHFNNAIAYKFYDETYRTEVERIEWTMGRTGVLTPIAIVKPIDIDGATITRASCHNVSILKELGLRYQGQEVDIFKANQIIPQIAKVYEWTAESASVKDMEIPSVCPICGEPTVVIESDTGVENLYCDNQKCEGKLINRLDHFCGKKGLDIKGLSKATLEKLIDWGWVTKLEEIFTLSWYIEEWKQKPGFGEKSVNNIISAIGKARDASLDAVISSIGIPLIGKTVSKDLAKRFKTYKNFRDAIEKDYDFTQIHGYGFEMQESLLRFDYSELDNIVKFHLNIIEEEPEVENSRTLGHLTFVITGKLQLYKNRDALKAEIEAHGGKVSGSVSKNTDYLINNDINSTSSKNKKAQELGVPIITEEKFKNIFDL